MKITHIISLLTILSLPAQAGQAIYKSVGHQIIYGNSQVQSITARGYLVFDPDTQRGTAIVGFTLASSKLFTVVPLQNYRVEHVTGLNGATYTIVAKAESPGTQFAGTILEAVYLRGRNTAVTIDSQGIRSLPRIFSSSAHAISQNSQSGVTVSGEVVGSYSLDIKGSLASNQSETFDAAVLRLANSFVSLGFTQFTPAPAQ